MSAVQGRVPFSMNQLIENAGRARKKLLYFYKSFLAFISGGTCVAYWFVIEVVVSMAGLL
jgi:hypothetical protein